MSMKRYSPLHSVVAAATADSTAIDMYSSPYFIGGRPQGRRGFSDRHSGTAKDAHPEIVSGDSHFHSVRDANRGFRSLNSSTQPNYNVVPPPPQHFTGQYFYGPGPQPGTPAWQQFSGPGPYADHDQRSYRPPPRQAGPPFGNNHQFRGQRVQQPSRPRASKPQDYRDWEYARPGPPPHCERFTVLSYNLLADYLAFDHWHKLYSHIPRYILDWSWRKRNISFELGLWSADVMCFQEVDRFQDIEAELKHRGYSGIWKMRTGDPVDGCATFWRVSRFKLLFEESIEYNKLGLRDNVAQICVLESLSGKTNSNEQFSSSTSSENSNRVVVCNIHVLFNPKRGDIKLGQIRVLLERAQVISKLWDDAPVVICGDFNCTPMSPVYNFILEQKLDLSELPRDKVSGQESAEIHLSGPSYPDFRMQSNDDSTQVSSANPKIPEQGGVPSAYLNDSRKEPSTESHSIPKCSVVIKTFGSCNSENDANVRANQLPGHDAYNFEGNSLLATQHSSPGIINVQSSQSQNLNSCGDEILNDTCDVNLEAVVDPGKFASISSTWTPMEIQTATGRADCKFVEHSLKLRSAYSEVPDSSGLRDSSGEPLVTSYHRRFLGTVDYIWLSEGLQASRVLAPIPKHVMQQTLGFPTKKWGSDHIALVSELAFTKDKTSANSSG